MPASMPADSASAVGVEIDEYVESEGLGAPDHSVVKLAGKFYFYSDGEEFWWIRADRDGQHSFASPCPITEIISFGEDEEAWMAHYRHLQRNM